MYVIESYKLILILVSRDICTGTMLFTNCVVYLFKLDIGRGQLQPTFIKLQA